MFDGILTVLVMLQTKLWNFSVYAVKMNVVVMGLTFIRVCCLVFLFALTAVIFVVLRSSLGGN